jgi:hypothetical protein
MQKRVTMETEPLEKYHLRINTEVREYQSERKLAYRNNQQREQKLPVQL